MSPSIRKTSFECKSSFKRKLSLNLRVSVQHASLRHRFSTTMRTREQVVKRRIAVRRLRTIDAKGYQQTRHRCRTPAELSSDATRQATHRRPVSSMMVGCTQVIDRNSLAKQWMSTRRAPPTHALMTHRECRADALCVRQQLVSSLFPYALQSTMIAFSIVQAPMHSTLQDSALAIAQMTLRASFAFCNRPADLQVTPQTQAVAASSFGASSSFRRKIMSRQVSVKDQVSEPLFLSVTATDVPIARGIYKCRESKSTQVYRRK
ncbi:hypothetical protein GGG16DRAFT_119522 [Schizophyllum commune]